MTILRTNIWSLFLFGLLQLVLCREVIAQTDSSDTEEMLSAEEIEKLIETAWENYPKNKVFQYLLEHASEKVFQETWSWLNTVNFTWQYTPTNIVNTNYSAPPQLGIGFIVNVGSIFSTPSRVYQAKQEKLIAKANIDNQKNYIAAEVMRRYYKYCENLDLLRVHTQAADDSGLIMNLVKYRFEQGEVNLEVFLKIFPIFVTLGSSVILT